VTPERFASILELKVSGLVEALMQTSGLNLEDALLRIYGSKLYEALEQEETKLWHHSPLLLLDCLESEFRTGKPEFPDE
jgi:hypothetical protein